MKAPKISRVVLKDSPFWRVRFTARNGERLIKHFVSEREARKFAAAHVADIKASGERASDISPELRAMAVEADRLLGDKTTILEAVKFWLADHERRTGGQPMQTALDAFLASREGFSAIHYRLLKHRCQLIGQFLLGKTTAEVDLPTMQAFFDGLAGQYAPKTIKHYREDAHSFFEFCVQRGWTTSNPVRHTIISKVVVGEIQFLSPSDASTLLSVCDPRILPAVILQMFAGIRKAEIERLDWAAVDLAQGVVKIGSGIAKTASRRVCSLPDNAKEWLAPYAQESGPIWPRSGDKIWRRTIAAAGYGEQSPWPTNGLRHSAISYKVSISSDVPKTAYESGNSAVVISKHYNALTSPQEAAQFFAIRPTSPANVIPIQKTA